MFLYMKSNKKGFPPPLELGKENTYYLLLMASNKKKEKENLIVFFFSLEVCPWEYTLLQIKPVRKQVEKSFLFVVPF